MPTRLKNLKERAQVIAKGLNHDMGHFNRVDAGSAWVSFCHGCGRQMMVDPVDGAGCWGSAMTEFCGPVPKQCCDMEIVELKSNPEPTTIAIDELAEVEKLWPHHDEISNVVKPKPQGKLKEFPDGSIYEMRGDGWRRRDDLRRRSS